VSASLQVSDVVRAFDGVRAVDGACFSTASGSTAVLRTESRTQASCERSKRRAL
jgi:hypothetical protein